jgi:hypothetical protein
MKKYSRLDFICRYEAGELRGKEVLELFSDLIKSGLAWSLQGCYGRMAVNLIKRGYLGDNGDILKEIDEV